MFVYIYIYIYITFLEAIIDHNENYLSRTSYTIFERVEFKVRHVLTDIFYFLRVVQHCKRHLLLYHKNLSVSNILFYIKLHFITINKSFKM